MTVATTKQTVQRCAKCGRRMKVWVYSKHTGKRYCWPNQGCAK